MPHEATDALAVVAWALYDWGCQVADRIDARHLPPRMAYMIFANYPGRVQVPALQPRRPIR